MCVCVLGCVRVLLPYFLSQVVILMNLPTDLPDRRKVLRHCNTFLPLPTVFAVLERARHLISASKGMRSIMEDKTPNQRLKLDDMPLFLKAGIEWNRPWDMKLSVLSPECGSCFLYSFLRILRILYALYSDQTLSLLDFYLQWCEALDGGLLRGWLSEFMPAKFLPLRVALPPTL